MDVTLIEAPSVELLAGLRDGTIDLAVIGSGSPPTRAIHVEVINDDVLVAAVGRGHALASRTSMSLRTLLDHDLICLPRGSGIRTGLEEAGAAARLQPRVALEASNPEVVAYLAACGLGVAVLPQSYARMRDDLHLVRLGRPTLRVCVGVAWRGGRTGDCHPP